jgi:hypothetical protein
LNKDIDHTKIDFKEKKRVLKEFENISDEFVKTQNQLSLELEECNCESLQNQTRTH